MLVFLLCVEGSSCRPLTGFSRPASPLDSSGLRSLLLLCFWPFEHSGQLSPSSSSVLSSWSQLGSRPCWRCPHLLLPKPKSGARGSFPVSLFPSQHLPCFFFTEHVAHFCFSGLCLCWLLREAWLNSWWPSSPSQRLHLSGPSAPWICPCKGPSACNLWT